MVVEGACGCAKGQEGVGPTSGLRLAASSALCRPPLPLVLALRDTLGIRASRLSGAVTLKALARYVDPKTAREISIQQPAGAAGACVLTQTFSRRSRITLPPFGMGAPSQSRRSCEDVAADQGRWKRGCTRASCSRCGHGAHPLDTLRLEARPDNCAVALTCVQAAVGGGLPPMLDANSRIFCTQAIMLNPPCAGAPRPIRQQTPPAHASRTHTPAVPERPNPYYAPRNRKISG